MSWSSAFLSLLFEFYGCNCYASVSVDHFSVGLSSRPPLFAIRRVVFLSLVHHIVAAPTWDAPAPAPAPVTVNLTPKTLM
jgi:hypothetical protein